MAQPSSETMMVISSTKRTSRKGIAANNISEICLWETSDSRKPEDIDTGECNPSSAMRPLAND